MVRARRSNSRAGMAGRAPRAAVPVVSGGRQAGDATHTRLPRPAWCAVVGAVLLAGCTGGAGAPADPEVVRPSAGDVPLASASPQSTGGAGAATVAARYGPSPLQAYNLTPDENATIVNATNALVGACMVEQGYTYTPDDSTTTAGASTDWDRYLGLVDAAQAADYGYWLPGSPAGGAREKEEAEALAREQNLSAQDEAYRAALLGPDFPEVSPDACYPRSSSALIPSGPTPNLSIQADLFDTATARAQADAAVVAARAAWQSCMADHGYDLSEIPLPSADADRSAAVVAQAVADVGCKDSSGLTDTYITTLYAAESAAIEEHLSDVQAYRAYVDERLRMAAQALTDAG